MSSPTKKLLFFLLSPFFFLVSPHSALAQIPFPNIPHPPGFKYADYLVGSVVGEILRYVFGFAGLAAFLFIVYAGFQFLISKGDPKQIEEAKNKLTQAIIGFLIVFASYWIVQIIEVILGVKIVSV